MPDAPTPDQVAAHLARMRENGLSWPDDVERLLAAVEAVLALHKPAGVCMDVRPCERHRYAGPKSFAQLRDARHACPDCTVSERVTCWQSKCREEEWPCTEYRAISAALLGEEKAGD